MKLQDFTGGLVTRLRPQFLNLKQAAVYTNINNAVGTLKAVLTKLAAGIETDKYTYFYIAQQEWVSSASFRSYVEYEDILHWTGASGSPMKYDGTTESNLGIEPPSTPMSANSAEYAPPIDELPLTSITAFGNLPDSSVLYYRAVTTWETTTSAVGAASLAYDFTVHTGTSAVNVITKTVDNQSLPPVGITDPAAGSKILSFGQMEYEVSNTAGTYANVRLFRLYDGVWRQVTLRQAVDPLPVTNIVDGVYDISGNAALTDVVEATKFSGVYEYLYTFYSSATGIESAPSETRVANYGDDTTDYRMVLSSIDVSLDPQVDEKRIYRVGGNITLFTLVTTIDNATTNVYDDASDTDIAGNRQLDSQDHTPPPSDLRYLTGAYAMLFGADGAKLRFSKIGEPWYWPESYYLQFDAPITGVAAVGAGLLVFTRYRAHVVLGTSPIGLIQQPLSGDQGCIAIESLQYVSDSAIWASTDGLCISNGGKVEVLTRNALGKLTLDVVNSALHDQVYYVLQQDGTILAYDYRFGDAVFKTLNLGVDSLAIGNDNLYGWLDGQLYELFAGSTEEEFSYTSPRFIEGSAVEAKTYKKVYIYSKGDIILNILINDIQVATKTFTTEGAHEVQVPHKLQRGQFIQLQLSGTGEVYELEYRAAKDEGHG